LRLVSATAKERRETAREFPDATAIALPHANQAAKGRIRTGLVRSNDDQSGRCAVCHPWMGIKKGDQIAAGCAAGRCESRRKAAWDRRS